MKNSVVLTLAITVLVQSPWALGGFVKLDSKGAGSNKSESVSSLVVPPKMEKQGTAQGLTSNTPKSETSQCGAALIIANKNRSASNQEVKVIMATNGCDLDKIGMSLEKDSSGNISVAVKAKNEIGKDPATGSLVSGGEIDKCSVATTKSLTELSPTASLVDLKIFLKTNGCDIDGLPGLENSSPLISENVSESEGLYDLPDVSTYQDAAGVAEGKPASSDASFKFSPEPSWDSSPSAISIKNQDPIIKDFCACKIVANPFNPDQNWAPLNFCVEKVKELQKSGMGKGKIRKQTSICKASELKAWYKRTTPDESKGNPECLQAIASGYPEYYKKPAEKMCQKGASAAELDVLTGCYARAEGTGLVEQDPKKKEKAVSKNFQECIASVMLPPPAVNMKLSDKYDVRSLGSVIASEFACVAGCEELCAVKNKSPQQIKDYQGCVVSRVGQEAAKAIFAELLKEGGMVGALASVGMDVSSCIQPKNATREVRKESELFCELLKPGMSSVPLSAQIINACPSLIKRCDKFTEKGDDKNPELLQACGNSLINCMKTQPTTAAIEGCVVSEFAELSGREYTRDRNNHDASFKQSMCIAGAAMSGVNALTSAYCADEKKFPTSEAKDACLKKARYINEIGTAGASVATCMQQGPKAITKEAEAQLNVEQATERKKMIQDRSICLTSKLGGQAVDVIGDALKLNESQRNLLGNAKDAAVRAQECNQITNAADKRACWASASLDTAADIVNGQDWIKDPNKRAIATATLRAASGMAQCGSISDHKQKQSCLVTAGLSGLGQMPGKVGEVAKLAAATTAVFGSFKDCKGDRTCVMGNVAKILPGNAGVYSKFAVQAWTLIKMKNKCHIPSKYLFQASGLVGLTGDVVTRIHHQQAMKKLKKEFGSAMVNEEKAKSEAGLFENAAAVVGSNNKKRNDERAEEAEAGVDVQSKAFSFQARNEEQVLKEQLITRPFYYTSAGLNAAGMTSSIFESIAEKAVSPTAYWAKCQIEDAITQPVKDAKELKNIFDVVTPSGGDSVTASYETIEEDVLVARREMDALIRNIHYAKINKDLPTDDLEAFAHYMDIQKYIAGDLNSLSLNDYQSVKQMDEFNTSESLADILRFIVSTEFKLISEAAAFDLGSVENIATGMAGGLFPGKEGFEQNEPGAYAEQITYEIIKRGLDSLCAKKNEAGTCEYTGKKTIEFAAKKLAKILLVKNKAQTNKMMSDGIGRVLIAGYGAYNLMNTIKENEKMIQDQRNRVKQLQLIEQKMIHGDGTEDKTGSVNWRKYITLDFIQEAIAATEKVDQTINLKICSTKTGRLDLKCACRGKGCFEVFPTKNAMFQKNQATTEQAGKAAYKTAVSTMNYPANIASQLMGGQIGSAEIDLVALQSNTEKLNKYNKTLLKHLNGLLIAQRKPALDIEASIKKQDALMFASLDPKLQEKIKTMGVQGLGMEMIKEADAQKPELADSKDNLATSGADAPEVATADEDPKAKEKSAIQAALDKKYQENMNSEFEIQDISGKKADNIFEQISKRYFNKFKPEVE